MSAVAPASASPRWLTGLVTGLAGLLYAYAVWNAVAHLIATAAPAGLSAIGWITLGFGIALPILVFVFALAIGRRRTAGEYALVLLAGLALVAVFWLNLVGYSILNMDELVPPAA